MAIKLMKALDILREKGWTYWVEDCRWTLCKDNKVEKGLTGFDVIAKAKEAEDK